MAQDRGAALRALHRPGDPFVLMNAWDVGSARLVAALGAQAIGTTSAGFAFTLGLPDGARISRAQAMDHASALVAATPLPVSADLENGYAETPEGVAETIRLAGEAGLAGASVEDTDLPGDGAYWFDLATDRIRAAAAASTLTGTRADGLAAVGVARISLGSGLARVAQAALLAAARAALAGDFRPLAGGAGGAEIDSLLARGAVHLPGEVDQD